MQSRWHVLLHSRSESRSPLGLKLGHRNVKIKGTRLLGKTTVFFVFYRSLHLIAKYCTMASNPTTIGTSVVTDKDIPGEGLNNSANNSIEDDSVNKPSTEAKPSQQYVTGAKLVSILLSITLIYFLVMLDMAIISVSIPSITSEFNSILDIGWYVCLLNPIPSQAQANPSLGTVVLTFSPILPCNHSAARFTLTSISKGHSCPSSLSSNLAGLSAALPSPPLC